MQDGAHFTATQLVRAGVFLCSLCTVELHHPNAGYQDRLGLTGKFVENSTKLTFLEITGYRIKYNTVVWFLELQIRRGRKV
jgi:hypothetical protein